MTEHVVTGRFVRSVSCHLADLLRIGITIGDMER